MINLKSPMDVMALYRTRLEAEVVALRLAMA